jgi:hypothetical protein
MTSKDFNLVIAFTFTLGLWYCIGYLQGYDAGEKWGRQAGREEAIVAATAPSEN